MKLIRLLSNLGYGSRKQVTLMLKNGWVTDVDGSTLGAEDEVELTDAAAYARILVDDEPLDPPPGMVLVLNKPVGYTCSAKDTGALIYDLLPPRFRERKPQLSSVGRLDRETSGLLLMTDDGVLLHRIISPKSHVPKVYEARLAQPLRGDEAGLFASGTLMLEGEQTPLAPVQLSVLGACHVQLVLTEGRYHQVRRMFAAVDNHVEALQRVALGGLSLTGLAEGAWRQLAADEIARIML
ncbi:MAG: rRNA pseudouridine synthase [Sterolibacterium sp.]|jgi:16S rRNA pseudouridine516 synthase|nr:rRNA pseudouridine synthase [Sterolibacterium sp.]